MLVWTYRDAGGQPASGIATPQPSAPILPAPAAAAPAQGRPSLGAGQGLLGTLLVMSDFITSPEAPFAAVGALAALIVLTALVAHVRRRPPG